MAVTRPVYFANMALLDHGARRGVEDSGGPGWKWSWLETALIPAGGWKFPLS